MATFLLLKVRRPAGRPVLKSHRLQGKRRFRDLEIHIENRIGSVRKGTDEDGTPWRTKMVHAYGYIKGAPGADGDDLDCYIGPNDDGDEVYVIHQQNPDTGEFDEHKVMLGFDGPANAYDAYQLHYDSPAFYGRMETLPYDTFKAKYCAAKKSLPKR